MVRNDLIAAERLVLGGGVGEHQGVFVGLVAEVVRNSLQLHQAADEVQCSIPDTARSSPTPGSCR